jgi:ketosteroid isomerase-like protein
MSPDNVEVVRQWTDGLQRGELGFEYWHPDLRIDNAAGWPVEASYQGHDGLERWWEDLAEAFTDFRMEVEEFVSLDEERVLTSQRFVGHFRTTGIAFDGPWASLFWVRSGKILRAKGYLSKRRAMRAAGLKA